MLSTSAPGRSETTEMQTIYEARTQVVIVDPCSRGVQLQERAGVGGGGGENTIASRHDHFQLKG